MTAAIIILVVYALSAYRNYKWIQKAYYHNKGIFYGLKPNIADLLFTFIPLMNTIISFYSLFIPPAERETNFFKPKNK